MSASLVDLLDDAALRRDADAETFARGCALMSQGMVTSLDAKEQVLVAAVCDDEERVAQIWIEDGRLRYACTCAKGVHDRHCPHTVAAARQWCYERLAGIRPPSGAGAVRSGWDVAREHPDTIDKRDLHELLSPHCGARRKLIALHTDPFVVRKILGHLGLPTEPPNLAPARTTAELAFDA